MSFFYSTADVKLNKNVHLTVFKPSSKSQTILVKGKLGQFKLEWNLQSFLEKIQTENQDKSKKKSLEKGNQLLKTQRGMSWLFTEGEPNDDLNKDIDSGKVSNDIPHQFVRKHFIFHKSKNGKGNGTIEDRKFSSNPSSSYLGYPLPKSKRNKDLENYWISTWPKKVVSGTQPIDPAETGKENHSSLQINNKKKDGERKQKGGVTKLKIGFIYPSGSKKESINQSIPLSATSSKDLENRNSWIEKGKNRNLSFARQLRNCMKGVTQGFTINLKLEGVGFEAKLVDDEDFFNKKKSPPALGREGTNFLGQDIGEILRNDCKDQLKVLQLNLGKSHSLFYEIPWRTVTISKDILRSTGIISIFSISLVCATQTAADIRRYGKVEAYKGKGISFDGDIFISKKEKK